MKLPNPYSVVKVGGGRGFIIEHIEWRFNRFARRRLVVTAAHCLPKLPPPYAATVLENLTYENLLRRLDGKKHDVWAECLFVDPVADVAVLGSPDNQELGKQADAYEALVNSAPALSIDEARSGKGWMLALNKLRWLPTKLILFSGLYGVSLSTGPNKGGMSGSPILNNRGHAIGVVVIGSEGAFTEESGPQAILTFNLPGWLLGPRRRRR